MDLFKNHFKQCEINLIDIGAKDGVKKLKGLESLINAFGYEPNPKEFRKLIASKKSNKTNFKRIEYFQKALGEQEGEADLFITKNPSLSSLLKVDWESHRNYYGLMKKYPYWEDQIKIKDKVKIELTTLSSEFKRLGLHQIDYLKLDTQGTELKVLKGAEELLKEGLISIIECEVTFIPVYKGQCTFSELDQYLRKFGYNFADCKFYKDEIYSPLKRKFRTKTHIVEEQRVPGGGDAFYYYRNFNEDQLNNKVGLKCGIILANSGYLSLSTSILQQYTLLKEDEIDEILRISSRKSFKQKVKDFSRRWLPQAIQGYLKNFMHKMHK